MAIKNSLVKDTFREIARTFSRFLALLIIIAIGIAFFVGIKSSCPDMKLTADKYYKDYNFMDFQIISTIGLNEEDIKQISAQNSIVQVMPQYSVDLLAHEEGRERVVKVMSMPSSETNSESINTPRLIEGRLPEKSGECVVMGMEYAVGTEMNLVADSDDVLEDYLTTDNYMIVGRVTLPSYLSRELGTSTIGTGQLSGILLVPESDFTMEFYTTALISADITTDSDKEIIAYSDEYKSKAKIIEDNLIAFSDARAEERYAKLIGDANAELSEATDKYNDAKNTANKEFTDAKQTLDNNQKEIDDAREKIKLSREQADAMPDSPTKSGMLTELTTQETLLNTSQLDLDEGFAEYNTKKADADKELSDALVKITDAEQEISDIPDAKWYVLGRDKNIGYVDYENAADRTGAIANVFPIIFALVAILICFTSMSRMVEEQRGLVGTYKALGYSKRYISIKFLIYGLMATVFGSGIGFTLGFTFFPYLIYSAYSPLYTVPNFVMGFDLTLTALTFLITIGVIGGAVLVTCYGELVLNVSTLMRPPAPRAGKVILLERIPFIWRKLKFSSKVTARNLLRYKRRFIMTVVGVGGCTALLLTGFGLYDSIGKIGDIQFGEIFRYGMSIDLKSDISQLDRDEVYEHLIQAKSIEFMAKSVNIENADGLNKDAQISIPKDINGMSDFVRMKERVGGEELSLDGDGVILTEKLAKLLDVKTGENVYINYENELIAVKVLGITEHYFQHYMYMSPDVYHQVYDKAPEYNRINVKLPTDIKPNEYLTLKEKLVPLSGVSSIGITSDSKSTFDESVETMYSVIAVLIVSAALLSFVVLYTLTTININERIREIATIKVLGFYSREVAGYVLRENMILSLFGGLFGILIGVPLTYYVIGTAEIDLMMFGREIYLSSYALSVGMTIIFAALVNCVMIYHLKKIDMIGALKSIE